MFCTVKHNEVSPNIFNQVKKRSKIGINIGRYKLTHKYWCWKGQGKVISTKVKSEEGRLVKNKDKILCCEDN